MIRKLAWLVAGLGLLLLGLIGLLLPVLPGLLLLAAAAGCFALASRRFGQALQRRLERSPRHRAALARWRAGATLSPWRRAQLGFWLIMASLLPASVR